MAGIVRDEGLSVGTRVTAFACLIRVHGDLDYSGKSASIPLSLADIDWEFVEEYYLGWEGK